MAVIAHGLLVIIKGYQAEVLVNDVPLVRTTVDRQKHASTHATPWTVDGENELRMVIERSLRHPEKSSSKPLPRSVTNDPESPWRASATLVEGEMGQIPRPEDVKELVAIDWAPPLDYDWTRPIVLRASFSLSGRPLWGWQGARPINLDDLAERARVLSFVRDVHADFAAKRIHAILNRMTAFFAGAPHLGATPDEARASLEQSFWQLGGRPAYKVRPYDDGDVVLRPVAEGKVVLVLRKDRTPLLQGSAGASESWMVPLFLANLEDGLEIVSIG